MDIWIGLCNAVSWNSPEIVENKLREYSGSILRDDGRLIARAIEENDSETYLVLMEYFDSKELAHLNRDSDGFKELVSKMREVITEAMDGIDLKRPMCDAIGIEFVVPVKIFKYIE